MFVMEPEPNLSNKISKDQLDSNYLQAFLYKFPVKYCYTFLRIYNFIYHLILIIFTLLCYQINLHKTGQMKSYFIQMKIYLISSNFRLYKR